MFAYNQCTELLKELNSKYAMPLKQKIDWFWSDVAYSDAECAYT